jgi:hypothetical protein
MPPQICESWLKSYLMQVCKPCLYVLIAAVEPFKLHPMSMAYIYEVFERFSGCEWAYGFTLTLLPPQTLPQICESWLKSYLMQVCKLCHYALVEAVEPFKLHPSFMSDIHMLFEHLLRLWMGIWLHTHTDTTTYTSPDLGGWLKSHLMQVCKPCHYTLFEAVEPFKLHPMSMAYIFEVFENLLRIQIGLWLHIQIFTSKDTSPDL